MKSFIYLKRWRIPSSKVIKISILEYEIYCLYQNYLIMNVIVLKKHYQKENIKGRFNDLQNVTSKLHYHLFTIGKCRSTKKFIVYRTLKFKSYWSKNLKFNYMVSNHEHICSIQDFVAHYLSTILYIFASLLYLCIILSTLSDHNPHHRE